MIFTINIPDEHVAKLAESICDATSDEMIRHLADATDYQIVSLALDDFVKHNSDILITRFPRRVKQLYE